MKETSLKRTACNFSTNYGFIGIVNIVDIHTKLFLNDIYCIINFWETIIYTKSKVYISKKQYTK